MRRELVPPNLRSEWEQTRQLLHAVDGRLVEREAEWLFSVAATCPAEGVVVEIGSFKGRSTIALARGVQAGGRAESVVAIDPHCAPAATDPSLEGRESSEADFRLNLARAQVSDVVDVRVQYSTAAAAGWDAPIRILWIDGDHTLEGARADFDSWTPFLSDDGILAVHDVLHRHEGPAPVFLQSVIESPGWSQIGFVKSIGFATRARDIDLTRTLRNRRQAHLLRRMISISRKSGSVARLRYRLYRAAVLRL